MSPFLNIGTSLATFKLGGKYEFTRAWLNMLQRCVDDICAPSFKSRGFIKSDPHALLLLVSRSLKTSSTSVSEICMLFIEKGDGSKGGKEAWLSSTLLCSQN